MTETPAPVTDAPPATAAGDAADVVPPEFADPPRPPGRAAASVEWWMKPVTRWASLVAITVLVIYLCWLMIAPFVDVIMWGVVLVVVFWPVHRRLRRRVRSPSLAAAISTLLVIVTILLPLALAGVAIARDANNFVAYLKAHKGDLLDPNAPWGRPVAWVSQYVDVRPYLTREYLADRLNDVGGAVAARVFTVLGGVVGVVVQMFFVVFTLFYLFRDGDRLRLAARGILPLDRWQAHDVFLRTKDVIRASVYGSLVIAAVQGTLGGLAFWALGVPSPLLWGVVMILLCMIPMAGAFVVWVPAAVYLLATGHPWKAAILTAWGAGVIGTIDNFLRPYLVGNRTRLHELIIFFAVLGGIQVFGVLGIITGPAVAAVAVALFEVWRQARVPKAAAAAQATAEPAHGQAQAGAAGLAASGAVAD